MANPVAASSNAASFPFAHAPPPGDVEDEWEYEYSTTEYEVRFATKLLD